MLWSSRTPGIHPSWTQRLTQVATRRQGTVTLRLEYVRCGKASCHCAKDQGHGPYWYAYARKAGRLTSEYIGKDAGKGTLG